MPHIDAQAAEAIAKLGGLDAIKWIDVNEAMPELHYDSSMRYWYSKPVLAANDYAIEVQVAMSQDGSGGSFMRPVGGRPNRWAHLA